MSTRVVSARLAAHIQSRIESRFYGDTAAVLTYTVSTVDAYGQPTTSTTTTAIDCSFTDKPNKEIWANFGDIEQIDAEIRFNSDTTPAKGKEVTLKGRFDGSAYTDKTYEIIGIRNRDAFGWVCALRAVQI